MEEITFKPRYALTFWFGIGFLGLVFFIVGGSYVQAGRLLSWWLPVLILVAAALILQAANMVKRILFQPNEIVIEYYFRPRKEIGYREISDFGENALWAGNFHLQTEQYSNRKNLLRITNSLKKLGFIDEHQLEGKLKISEDAAKMAITITFFATMLVAITVPFILAFWFPTLNIGLGTIIDLSFAVIFPLAFFILKIRASRN